jgi:hypothetical protein
MNAKSLSKIALRVLAVFFIFEGIGNLPMLARSISSYGSSVNVEWFPFWESAVLVAPILLGIVVWVLAGTITAWMIDHNDTGESTRPIDASTLQAIALVTLGIFFIIQCIPNIAGALYVALAAPANQPQTPLLHNGYLLEEALKLILAIVLVLGARFFTKLFRRLREFGLARP